MLILVAPPKPLNQRGGGPALKPIKSDSCPQSYKKTTSRLDRPGQLALRFKRAPCLADGRAARVDSAEACGRVRGAARSVAGRGGQAPMRAAERASKTCRSIGTAHSPTPRPGRTSLRLPAGLHRRLARASAVRRALAPQAGLEPVAGNEILCTERSIAPLASRRRQQPPVAHAPASLNVLRARRKRAVSGAGLELRARTFRTTASQALAALGVAHP